MSGPNAKLVLLEDFDRRVPHQSAPDTEGLRTPLMSLPGFSDVELTADTGSTVIATVEARNQREIDPLTTLVNEQVDGWHVIDTQTYGVPKTF